MRTLVARCSYAGLVFTGCLLEACGDYCTNKPIKRVGQASKSLDAVVYVRNCGATTPLVTSVSIVSSDLIEVTGPGNAFAAMDTSGSSEEPNPVEAPPLDVVVRWIGEKEIQILYDRRLKILRPHPEERGIMITLVPH